MSDFGINLSSQSVWVIAIVAIAYVSVITLFGGYFARFNKNINDFFYSGQRFSWWLPAASMVATGIGSYSFLKYSEQGYNTGMSSTMTYMNDWFLVPFFIFGWLPIIYFSRIKSIPEYFERRFNRTARYLALVIIMCYMLYYIGYNLYTIGVAMNGLFGVPLVWSVPLLSIFLGAYVTYGGQTAVVFTDLFQGIMLYLAGFLAVFAGIYALGGFDEWWDYLPTSHRLPFVHLTENPKFNTAGLFWGEALAGSIAFSFMNQGFLMRFLTIKSVDDARKAGFFNVLITLPVSAIIVGAVGWIGRSLINKQAVVGGALEGLNLIHVENTFHTFLVVCWETLYQNPWIFGFIISALMAALMSTIDTLINACAAIGIYDLYKPLFKKEASDKHYLKAARWASIISTAVGMLLVIWFAKQKGSLMSIHYKGIMVIIPAIVTTIFLGAFWRGFTSIAANVSMVAGSLLTLATVKYPGVLSYVAQFVSGPDNGQFIYLRALFGMVATGLIGISISWFTKEKPKEELVGLTIDSIGDSMNRYKGGEINPEVGKKLKRLKVVIDNSLKSSEVQLSKASMDTLKARDGDLIYLSDSRWYLGGLRSEHLKGFLNASVDDGAVVMSEQTFNEAYLVNNNTVNIEKIF